MQRLYNRVKRMKIMGVKEFLERIVLEHEREDKKFIKLEFNIRSSQVVMNYIYEDKYEEEVHKVGHDADPEFMDIETFELLKEYLCEERIPFEERRDEFL